jgi:hypothetical protein
MHLFAVFGLHTDSVDASHFIFVANVVIVVVATASAAYAALLLLLPFLLLLTLMPLWLLFMQ